MARSIDILTSDEKHLVVFAKGVTLDKSLPKYIRIKEKKESSSKEDTFNNWKSIFDNYLNEIISECTDIYLNKMGLKVRIDIDYNFGGKHWLAAYEGSSDDLSRGVITIEEEIVEEFGESMFPEATGRWSSYLGRIINKI